jgi:hypothetical protein
MTFQCTSTSSAGATRPRQFVKTICARRLDTPNQMNSQGKSPFKRKRFFHALAAPGGRCPTTSNRGYSQSNSGVPNALFQTVRKRGNQE